MIWEIVAEVFYLIGKYSPYFVLATVIVWIVGFIFERSRDRPLDDSGNFSYSKMVESWKTDQYRADQRTSEALFKVTIAMTIISFPIVMVWVFPYAMDVLIPPISYVAEHIGNIARDLYDEIYGPYRQSGPIE
jgi:hypothetical protein